MDCFCKTRGHSLGSFQIQKRGLKTGDLVILTSKDACMGHLSKGNVYTVLKAYPGERFCVEKCDKPKCTYCTTGKYDDGSGGFGGAWLLNQDFCIVDSMALHLSKEEMKQVISLPSISEVADFFKVNCGRG